MVARIIVPSNKITNDFQYVWSSYFQDLSNSNICNYVHWTTKNYIQFEYPEIKAFRFYSSGYSSCRVKNFSVYCDNVLFGDFIKSDVDGYSDFVFFPPCDILKIEFGGLWSSGNWGQIYEYEIFADCGTIPYNLTDSQKLDLILLNQACSGSGGLSLADLDSQWGKFTINNEDYYLSDELKNLFYYINDRRFS